jgi:hypothetical protein
MPFSRISACFLHFWGRVRKRAVHVRFLCGRFSIPLLSDAAEGEQGNKPIPSFRLFLCDISIPCFRQNERSPSLVLWLIQHEQIISIKRHPLFSLFLPFHPSFSSIGETQP